MPLFYKEPTEKFDYQLQWTLSSGDSIVSSVWASTPAGLTLSAPSFGVLTAPVYQTTTWIESGTLDTDYTLTNTIVTTQGRTDIQTVTIRVAVEIISTAAILASLPGGDGFEFQEAREIVESALARVKAAQGGVFTNEPFSRSVVRRLARAEIWGDILRQSGHLSADETTKEEDRADKILKEYDASKTLPTETNSKITTGSLLRG